MDHTRELFTCDFFFLLIPRMFLDDECDQAKPVHMLKLKTNAQRQKLLVGTDDRVAVLQQNVGGYFEHGFVL